ncbi:hypothetical protein AB6F61_13670 [Providencia hangzhouensis]|uniref:hypothetical protein n=1 Tax=Providencia hangzhouensis TaxID=3031799 RepID=UPI0034DD90FD
MKHQIIMRIIGSEQGLITKPSNSKNDAILINSISYSREKDEKIDITSKYFIDGEEPSIINYNNVIIDSIRIVILC